MRLDCNGFTGCSIGIISQKQYGAIKMSFCLVDEDTGGGGCCCMSSSSSS